MHLIVGGWKVDPGQGWEALVDLAAPLRGGGLVHISPSLSLPQFPWLVKTLEVVLCMSVRTPTHEAGLCTEGLGDFPCVLSTPALATC